MNSIKGKPLRILIVEDSRDDAELLAAELRRAGFEPVWKRVQEQTDFLEEILRKPDIILCDYSMPNFDGLQAARLLQESNLDIPFILVSGTLGEEFAVEAIKLGAADYLLKDRIARLGSAVQRALEEKESREQRRRAEAALRESEEKFRQLAENINEVFWIADPSIHEIFYVSPAYERIWGRSCQSLYGLPQSWALSIHEEDRERVLKASRTKQISGQYEETYRIVRPDGSLRWIHDRGFPVPGADGAVYRFVGIAEDITEQKETARQLLQAQKMECLGQLAGGIAHDFNNMLMVVQLNLELMSSDETPLPPACQDRLAEIALTVTRAAALNRQLLTFSRKKNAQMQPVDLNQLTANFTKLLLRIVGEHITVRNLLAPAPAVIMADPGMLEQLIMNLAVNARDAMHNGGELVLATETVEIDDAQARQALRARPGRFLCLSVRDTGVGIAPENMSRIFEPFFTTKDVGKGTGLGLATVFGIVQQHLGWIDVSSQLGVGTTFRIYLPFGQGVSQEIAQTQAPPIKGGKENILVVEDEVAVRQAMVKALQSQGYRVIEANSATSAQTAWIDHLGLIDLVITDMVMPGGLSGLNLIERLRASKPDLKAVLMSGYSAEMANGEFVLPADVVALVKPFPIRVLADAVRKCLDGR